MTTFPDQIRHARSRLHHCRRALRNLLLPPVCIACNTSFHTDTELQICQSCQSRIGQGKRSCQCLGCGARMKGDSVTVESCPVCKDLRIPFSSVTAIGNYEGLLKDLVIRMKRSAGHAVAIQMGHWLAENLSQQFSMETLADIHAVTAVPIHWTRHMKRGHDIGGLLVESVCRLPELRGKNRSLVHSRRRTRKQGTLTRPQRFENVKGCFGFSGKSDVAGTTILLIDDVMTSGATAFQAATVLQNAGAADIRLAIVARSIGRQLE